MSTTIEIDDAILQAAMHYADGLSEQALIERVLKEYVNARRRQSLVESIEQGDLGIDLTTEDCESCAAATTLHRRYLVRAVRYVALPLIRS